MASAVSGGGTQGSPDISCRRRAEGLERGGKAATARARRLSTVRGTVDRASFADAPILGRSTGSPAGTAGTMPACPVHRRRDLRNLHHSNSPKNLRPSKGIHQRRDARNLKSKRRNTD